MTRLHAKLSRRRTRARKWSDYYDGKHPLLFASPEFKSVTGGLFEGFADNWTQTVADATAERMRVLGFRGEDGSLDLVAGRAWRRSECHVESRLAILESLITGRSFGLVWKPDGVTTEITFEHEGRALVEYVPGRRRIRAFGLLTWRDDTYEFATLFTPVMVYRWQRKRGGGRWVDRTAGLKPSESAHNANPLGLVPLVELPNRARLGGKPVSEIKVVARLQDAVNTLWLHLMTASDHLALPARAVLGMDRPTREIVDDDGEVVGEEDLPIDRFRSDRLLWLESRDASIAEFSAADLGTYLAVIERAVEHIAAQTRTPAHYMNGSLINVNADTLNADESGLVAKVSDKTAHAGAGLREIMRLEALAAGETARAESLRFGEVVWSDPQFRSEAQYADALVKLKSIDVPSEALWERIPGVTPEVIERWRRMRDDQGAAILGGNIAGLFGPKNPDDQVDQVDAGEDAAAA